MLNFALKIEIRRREVAHKTSVSKKTFLLVNSRMSVGREYVDLCFTRNDKGCGGPFNLPPVFGLVKPICVLCLNAPQGGAAKQIVAEWER